MTETYLTMMEESLDRKVGVLERIKVLNETQHDILKNEEVQDTEGFDKTVDEKERLIAEIIKLNDGFDSLYEHVREALSDGKEQYREQIGRMQEKIRTATALSNVIEAGEARNRQLAERFFTGAKEKANENRKSANAAINYYRTMSKSNYYISQLLDKKN